MIQFKKQQPTTKFVNAITGSTFYDQKINNLQQQYPNSLIIEDYFPDSVVYDEDIIEYNDKTFANYSELLFVYVPTISNAMIEGTTAPSIISSCVYDRYSRI